MFKLNFLPNLALYNEQRKSDLEWYLPNYWVGNSRRKSGSLNSARIQYYMRIGSWRLNFLHSLELCMWFRKAFLGLMDQLRWQARKQEHIF